MNPWVIGTVALVLLGAGFHVGRAYERAGCQDRMVRAVQAERFRVEAAGEKAEGVQNTELQRLDQIRADQATNRKEVEDAARSGARSDRLCLDADGVRRLRAR